MANKTVLIRVNEKEGLKPELYFLVFEIEHKCYKHHCVAHDLDAAIKKVHATDKKAAKENLWFYHTVDLAELQYQFKKAV